MHKIVRLLAILSGMLEASKCGAVAEIEAGLDQLCLAIKVRRAFVYLCTDDGACKLTYRSSATAPERIDSLPKTLPNQMITAWRKAGADRRSIQISGADFLVNIDGHDPEGDQRNSERIILFPMACGERFVGVTGYAGLGKGQSGNETVVEMLRELTGVLQSALAHDGRATKALKADGNHASVLATPLDHLTALQGYSSIEAVVSKLKDQETAMTALASVAKAAHLTLTNAIQALPDGVVIFDAEDRLVAVNAAYHRAFPDLAAYAVVGVKLADLLRIGLEKGAFMGDATDEAREAWLQTRLLQYRKPHWDDEVQLPDGRWMHRVSTRTSDGGVIAMGFDITAKRNQIAALDAANRNLTQVLVDRDRAELRLGSIIEGA
ncbi:PAS-domain containing protein, partial [Cypionkella sp.]|uniref:PAS-domain containing protein n=1 Tax=Cypionkella sp. TaxID=2811411 RepID=UPI002AC99021